MSTSKPCLWIQPLENEGRISEFCIDMGKAVWKNCFNQLKIKPQLFLFYIYEGNTNNFALIKPSQEVLSRVFYH